MDANIERNIETLPQRPDRDAELPTMGDAEVGRWLDGTDALVAHPLLQLLEPVTPSRPWHRLAFQSFYRRHRAELTLGRLSSAEPRFSQMRRSSTSTAVSGLVYGRLAENSRKGKLLDPVEGRRRVFTGAGRFFSDSRDLPL